MTTYIAGRMTGLPDYNYPAFNAAAAELRAQGVDVRNPAELNDLDEVHADQKPWDWYVRRAIRALLDCDEIVLLPGWEQSKGAQLEHHIACALGMRVTSAEVPKALAEQLDAAQSGEEFGGVLEGLFGWLEKARDEAENE